jgi:uncharacterized protein (DUF433 family)
MEKAIKKYPYITHNPEILNGVPIIKGTRIPVRTVGGFYQMGQTVDELLMNWPWLKSSEVFSALAYYFDHQEEIDNDNNENYNLWVEGIKKQELNKNSTDSKLYEPTEAIA